MVNRLVVRGPQKITAAVCQVFPADITVFLVHAFVAVAVFVVTCLMVDAFIMEMAESPPFIGEDFILIFHDIFFIGSILYQIRIMGMVMGSRHFLLMVVIMMVVMVMMMVMIMGMTGAFVMMGRISFLFTSGIVFMDVGYPFMMVAVAVAAAAVMGMNCLFFIRHINSSLLQ
jgi:hypothetical protein